MGGISIGKLIEVVDGVECLRCRSGEAEDCEGLKPLDAFPKWSDGKTRTICRKCLNARARRYVAEGRTAPRPPEKRKEAMDLYNKRHPGRRSELQKGYMQRMRADPERYATFLENRRIEARLRAEKQGRTMRASTRGRTVRSTAPRRVPSRPLLGLVDRIVDNRKAVGRLIDETADGSLEAVCADLDLAARTLRRWRTHAEGRSREGGTVNVGLAETVLLNAGVEWHEVYSYDDHAEAFLASDVIA